MTKLLSSFAALATLTNARMSLGGCPDVDYVSSLDAKAYAGKWYEIEKDPMFPYTMGSECTFKEFTHDTSTE